MCFTYKNRYQETRKKFFFVQQIYVECIRVIVSSLDFKYPLLSEKIMFTARLSHIFLHPTNILGAERRAYAHLFSKYSEI